MGEARHVFENNEMIMDFVNSHPEFNTHIKWGTLSDYFELAHSRLRPSDIPHLRLVEFESMLWHGKQFEDTKVYQECIICFKLLP